MRVPNNPFQNPFYNRVNDPVTRRHDDMEAYAWLRAHNDALRQASQAGSSTSASTVTKKPALGVKKL